MKTLRRLAYLGLLLAALVTVFAFTGCKSPQQTALAATTVTVDTVNVAVDVWNGFVKAGKASDGDKSAVRKAWNSYQAALKLEETTIISLYNQPGSTPTLDALLAATEAAKTDFMNLVYSIVHN